MSTKHNIKAIGWANVAEANLYVVGSGWAAGGRKLKPTK